MTTASSKKPNDQSRVSVEEWLTLIIREQYSGGPQLLPSERVKQKGASNGRSGSSSAAANPTISNYFDAKQFAQLSQKTVSVKLTANAKPSKSNKKYFQDPVHELALFLVIDGRSVCNTCVCAIGCYNIPEPYRSCEEYLFRAATHPQHPDSHDFDEWLHPLVDELAHLSLKGFKTKDANGVLRTYKAHLVTFTDDLFDRTMLLCSHLPKSKTEAFCPYCTTQRKLRPGQEYATHKRRGRYADEDARATDASHDSDGHHNHHHHHHGDDSDMHHPSDDDAQDEDDDLVDDCDCQLGYYEPISFEATLPKTRKNMPWTPYGRCLFERLGSMSSPHSLVPDIAHICHHVMDDMYWLFHLMCITNGGDSGELAWDYKWPSRHPKVGPMVVDSALVPDGAPVEFPAFFAKYGSTRDFADGKSPGVKHRTGIAITVFIHIMTELLQEKFTTNQLDRIENLLRWTKYTIFQAIKNNAQWGPMEFFHYPMHLVDHLVECIRQTGPLVPTMTLHLLAISDRTTQYNPKQGIPFRNELEIMRIRRTSMASIPRRQEIHSGHKYKSKRFVRDCEKFYKRIEAWVSQMGYDISNVNIKIFQTRSLPENALDMQNVRSYLWDGLPHLVRLSPASQSRKSEYTQEYALLAGYFRIEIDGRPVRRALVQKMRYPRLMGGFYAITVDLGGLCKGTPMAPTGEETMTIGYAVDLVEAFEEHLTVVALSSVVEEYELSYISMNCYSICMRDKQYNDKGDLLMMDTKGNHLAPDFRKL